MSDNTSIGFDETLYKEACEGIFHFSLAVRNLRTISLVQGTTILVAVSLLVSKSLYVQSFFASVFGIIVTMLMYNLHEHYKNHLLTFLEYTKTIESGLDKKFLGPWRYGMIQRDNKKQSSKWRQFLLDKCMYYVFVISYFVLMVVTIISLK